MIIPVSFAALRARITENENLASFLDVFRTAGFAVDSWRAGGAFHTLARALARGLLRGTDLVRGLAEGAFLETATGDWLTLLAASWFGPTRRPASHAVQTFTMHNAPGSVPYTIVPGQIWVSTSVTPGQGIRFNNTTGGLLGASAELPLEFRAEVAGSDGNAELGTATVLVTAMPGVDVTNTAVVTEGLDEELDEELRDRCRDRWATLAPPACMPGAGWEFWARTLPDGTTARPGVTRAYCDIDNPDGVGSIRVYLAGPSGAVDGSVIAAVDDDLQARAGGIALTTLSAVERPINPIGTVWYRATDSAALRALVVAALEAMLRKAPIGGYEFPIPRSALLTHRGIFRDHLEDAVRSVPGVVRVSFAPDGTLDAEPPTDDAPADFLLMLPHQVAVGAEGDWPGIIFEEA